MSSALWLTPPHDCTPKCPFSAVRGQGIHVAPKFPAEHRGLYKTAAPESSAAVYQDSSMWKSQSAVHRERAFADFSAASTNFIDLIPSRAPGKSAARRVRTAATNSS